MLPDDAVAAGHVPAERGSNAGGEDANRRIASFAGEAAKSKDSERARLASSAQVDAMGEDWPIAHELETIESAGGSFSFRGVLTALPSQDGGTTTAPAGS